MNTISYLKSLFILLHLIFTYLIFTFIFILIFLNHSKQQNQKEKWIRAAPVLIA